MNKENKAIKQITKIIGNKKNNSLITGIGDDCAVVKISESKSKYQLLTTDVVVENVHFFPETAPKYIARKALNRCISDISAMGGKPQFALISIMINPKLLTQNFLQKFYHSAKKNSQSFNFQIIGGELSSLKNSGKNTSNLAISITMTGIVKKNHLVERSGAEIGDNIFITGKLGGSLETNSKNQIPKNLNFKPRLRQSTWLVQNFKPNSMMDISDGLAQDLPRLLKKSQKGAIINFNKIPYNNSIQGALIDGEDYELLFTIPDNKSKELKKSWQNKFPKLPLTKIGKICPKQNNKFKLNQKQLNQTWQHF